MPGQANRPAVGGHRLQRGDGLGAAVARQTDGPEHEQQAPGHDEDEAADQQAQRQRQQPVHFGRHRCIDTHPRGTVGVHDHDDPVPALQLPLQRLIVRALGHPEVLLTRGLGLVGTVGEGVLHPERIDLDIVDPGLGHTVEVGGDGRRRPDPDEGRGLPGSVHLDADGGQVAGVEPAGVVRGHPEVELVGGDRRCRRVQALGRRGEEPVAVALGGVGPGQAGAHQRDQPGGQHDQDAGHDHEDPADGRVGRLRRRPERGGGGAGGRGGGVGHGPMLAVPSEPCTRRRSRPHDPAV